MGTSLNVKYKNTNLKQCCNADNYKNEKVNEIGTNIHPSDKLLKTDNKIETENDIEKSKFNFEPSNVNSLNAFTFHNINNSTTDNNNLRSFPYKNITSIFSENENEILTRINNIKNVIDKSPILNIEIKSSPIFQIGTSFKIGPLGLISYPNQIINNNRNLNNGIVYFGYCPGQNTPNSNNYVDIQLPPKDIEISTISSINNNGNNNKYIGRYFYVFFNPDFIKYYIRDCGFGIGTFIKIQNETLLKDNSYINIGNSFISVSIGYDEESNYDIQFDGNKISPLQNLNKDYNNNLNLKILCKGKIIYDPINFQPTKSTIRIGRNSNCEVVVEDHLLSRIHCTIVYRKNIGWIIRDGVYNKNKDGSIEMKPSTNGTWLYALEDMPIYEGMIIKSNNNLFKFSFLK